MSKRVSYPMEPLEAVQKLMLGGYIKWSRPILPRPSKIDVFMPQNNDPDVFVGRITEGSLLKLLQYEICSVPPRGMYMEDGCNVVIYQIHKFPGDRLDK